MALTMVLMAQCSNCGARGGFSKGKVDGTFSLSVSEQMCTCGCGGTYGTREIVCHACGAVELISES